MGFGELQACSLALQAKNFAFSSSNEKADSPPFDYPHKPNGPEDTCVDPLEVTSKVGPFHGLSVDCIFVMLQLSSPSTAKSILPDHFLLTNLARRTPEVVFR
ncbi:MAG TPA: hypothetical protein V6C72_08565 [Chroococcales cyanobacterium]